MFKNNYSIKTFNDYEYLSKVKRTYASNNINIDNINNKSEYKQLLKDLKKEHNQFLKDLKK